MLSFVAAFIMLFTANYIHFKMLGRNLDRTTAIIVAIIAAIIN